MKEKLSRLVKKVAKHAVKYSSCALAFVAVTCTAAGMGRCCYFFLHQPEVPAEAKKYRKF